MSVNTKRYNPPRLQWTEKQTYRLLELINSSQTYINTFFPSTSNDNDDNTGNRLADDINELEKELCLLILDETEWMKWMISNRIITNDRNGLSVNHEKWINDQNPVHDRLNSVHSDAKYAQKSLGNAISVDDLKLNSVANKAWKEHQNLNKFTWYFLYVQAQLVNNPNYIINLQSQILQHKHNSKTSASTSEQRSDSGRSGAAPSCIPHTDPSSPKQSKSYRPMAVPSFPQSLLPDRPLSTPIRSIRPTSSNSLSNPTRPASVPQRRSVSSNSTPTNTTTTTRPAPRSLDNGRSKRARTASTDLAKRIGERAPPVIDICSDSEDEEDRSIPLRKGNPHEAIVIDDSDEDEVIDQNQNGSQSSTAMGASPGVPPIIPIPGSSALPTYKTPSRPALNQAENLEAIRSMSGSFMRRSRHNSKCNSESDSESDDSSRPPTPPFPPSDRQSKFGIDTTSTSSSSRAISPHFIEDIFRDPKIRSYRLDALHERLGLPLPPSRQYQGSAPSLTTEPPPISLEDHLTLEEGNGGSHKDHFEHHLRYPPLVISDGTIQDFPINILSSPHLSNNVDEPIEISDDEEEEEEEELNMPEQTNEAAINSLQVHSRSNHVNINTDKLSTHDVDDEQVDMDIESETTLEDMELISISERDQYTPEREMIEHQLQTSDDRSVDGHKDDSRRITDQLPIQSSISSLPLPPSITNTATFNAASSMIRMLLSELRHTRSKALSGIKVVLQIDATPFKQSLMDLIEMMGGLVKQQYSWSVDNHEIKYIVVGSPDDYSSCTNESSSLVANGGQKVNLIEFMGILADLREKELA
ncbi:uncharacterized protein L201_006188 [Kwoniella dendrophila CBS 6074]|uniref:BRCT domain-containing protein n=1 Tax=Kwoniella dendrophila CBS 6074 TaxID=1295534 RepID=A0AAX4K343_9TREE